MEYFFIDKIVLFPTKVNKNHFLYLFFFFLIFIVAIWIVSIVCRLLVGSISFGLGLFESPFVLLGLIDIWINVFGLSLVGLLTWYRVRYYFKLQLSNIRF